MSRHLGPGSGWAAPRNLRLGALILVFIAINQIDDPLVNATLGQEMLYWTVRILVLAAGLWTADLLVSKHAADRWTRPAWLKPVIVVSVVGLLPFALAESLLEPHLPMRPEFVDDDLRALSPVLAIFSEYVTVLSVFIPAHFLLWLIIDRKPHPIADAEVPAPAAPSLPEFLSKSSLRRIDDVLALQADEHYVRIHTEAGVEMVHYRFGDAVKDMPDALGLRVHRSWWVADSAVRSATRGARRWQLELTSGDAVPVSDSYVGTVRERGWLKRKRAR